MFAHELVNNVGGGAGDVFFNLVGHVINGAVEGW